MLKEHPKGLLVAFFSNMGERFGFYTMMGILVYFLQARYGLAADNAGLIYSIFYASIYGLALVGGLIADRTRNYKGVINIGIITMFAGYILMAVPRLGLPITILGLFTIAFGNGLFKGNLQAVVGQMYDHPKYSKLRDSAFTIFYMGINIGAFFAPSAAKAIRNWYLSINGLGYNSGLPSLCHQYLDGTLVNPETFQQLADAANGSPVADLSAFAERYINAFSTGFNLAFGIAAAAMLISLIVYRVWNKKLPDVRKEEEEAKRNGEPAVKVPQMSKEVEKQRLIALGLVFLVVIFFWMSFHQNGLTMSLFARDYTVQNVDALSFMFFDIIAFLGVIGVIIGLVLLVRKNSAKVKSLAALLVAGCGYLSWVKYQAFDSSNTIEPELFQHFNPIFIVFLTPIVLAFFAFLRKRDMEPTTPKKIGIGMILAAVAFVLLLVGSLGLPSPSDLNQGPSPDRVSHFWLIGTYFIITIAELFLSPMGISFVSKVAPPRLQGLAQGGWLAATALGNQLLFVGTVLWSRVELWQVWGIFILCCLASATFIFSVLKKLERAAASK